MSDRVFFTDSEVSQELERLRRSKGIGRYIAKRLQEVVELEVEVERLQEENVELESQRDTRAEEIDNLQQDIEELKITIRKIKELTK